MKKEYEALEIEIKKFGTVNVMAPSDIEDGGDMGEENERE